ncbi:LPS translocon maturation chaperone LptM [Ralstonia solanacearum]|uniref:LPS translocon maturation chaperone LptM n=1 Tax=Ralstonia solanacearum TaxID=305 RepID=UPI0018D0ECD5|nr:lipoprotein [Ralstonia solanacearum]
MIRTAAIVATVGLALTAAGLSGCGIRGPLYLPTVPTAPTAPTTTDPGITGPNAVPQPPVPGTRAAPNAASAVPASR